MENGQMENAHKQNDAGIGIQHFRVDYGCVGSVCVGDEMNNFENFKWKTCEKVIRLG